MGVTRSALTSSRTKRSGWALTLRPSSSSSMLTRRCADQSGRKVSGPNCSSRARRGWSRPSPAAVAAEAGAALAPAYSSGTCATSSSRRTPRLVEGAEAHEVLGDLAADARARHEVRQRGVRPRRAGAAGLPARLTSRGDRAGDRRRSTASRARRERGRGGGEGGEGGSLDAVGEAGAAREGAERPPEPPSPPAAADPLARPSPRSSHDRPPRRGAHLLDVGQSHAQRRAVVLHLEPLAAAG